MIFKADSGQGGDLNGFVDRGSQLHGELKFDHSFRVDGKVTGQIISSGDLIVGDSGEVDAEVEVGRLFVNGTVRGNVRALKKVQVSPGGKVFASLETPSLVIEDGAHFEGQCAMPMPGGKRASAGSDAKSSEAERRPGGPQLVSSRGGEG